MKNPEKLREVLQIRIKGKRKSYNFFLISFFSKRLYFPLEMKFVESGIAYILAQKDKKGLLLKTLLNVILILLFIRVFSSRFLF